MSMPDTAVTVRIPALACPSWCHEDHPERVELGSHCSRAFGRVMLGRGDDVAVSRDGTVTVTVGTSTVFIGDASFSVADARALLADLPAALAALDSGAR